MRRIIIANTYYQLLLSVQLKFSLFKNDEVFLLFSDHSKNAENIVNNIKKYHLFEHVKFIRSKNLVYSNSRLTSYLNLIKCILFRKSIFSFYLKGINNLNIDEILYFNPFLDVECLYIELSKYNPQIRLSMFEEGLLSYSSPEINLHPGKVIKLLHFFCRKIYKINIYDSFYNFYCYFPELYQSNKFNSVRVPLITPKSKTANYLLRIFKIDKDQLDYHQKYIFFTSVYDFEGEPIGEFELVTKIAQFVGKDNLLIKQHPRDLRTIYRDNGFVVDVNSSIPWEVIQLVGNFENKVYLTVNSGSVLCANTLSSQNIKVVYMYKFCNYTANPSCVCNIHDLSDILNNIHMKSILHSVYIGESFDDIRQ